MDRCCYYCGFPIRIVRRSPRKVERRLRYFGLVELYDGTSEPINAHPSCYTELYGTEDPEAF